MHSMSFPIAWGLFYSPQWKQKTLFELMKSRMYRIIKNNHRRLRIDLIKAEMVMDELMF